MDTDELDEVMVEFITETYENLDELDAQLVELEQDPDPAVIAKIFRSIHTIKGTSGFLGLSTLESVTHVGENLLSKLRDGALPVTQDNTSALLALVDAVRSILSFVESERTEGTDDYRELVVRLDKLGRPEEATDIADPDEAVDVVEVVEVVPLRAIVDRDPTIDRRRGDRRRVDRGDGDDEGPPLRLGELLLRDGLVTDDQLEQALAKQRAGDPRHVGELLVEQAGLSSAVVADVLKKQSDRRAAVDTIRVDVGLLDDLMNMVGELVLARNQILQFTQEQHDPTFIATSQRLNLITTELQEGVMKTRMQPIENVWNKFPRVVRDLTIACGKQARVEMVGKNTELDKTLLEAIKDPLTHLVRNAIDHGLETPEAREAVGKSPEGVIALRAYHEGGQVVIEISDDGAGMDADVIREKAVKNGLLSAEEAAARSDRDILNVIFLPGFSTADQVSNISGRGVGMDIVKTNIESIGGSADVQTVVGQGTTVKVKIPLTLAIIPALLVTSSGDRYAIPQVSLVELLRLDGETVTKGIERIQGVPFYRLRGRLLPLVFLDTVFADTMSADRPSESSERREAINIVVVQADDRQFGLVVDEINDTAEIVVKPLGKLLNNATAFAGATIMGDGRVALILDVMGIANHVGIGGGQRLATGLSDESVDASSELDRRRLLLFGLGDRRLGLPLEAVARLEEFDSSDIEISSHQPVVQYRGEIMHLVDVGTQLGVRTDRQPEQPMEVVVYTENGISVGLVVDQIFDIVEEAFQLNTLATAHGIQGSAEIQGAVIDVLDVRSVLDRAVPGLMTAGAITTTTTATTSAATLAIDEVSAA
jgi:two-component system, chemotaxis family, sensor kinase CheA